MIAGMRPLDLAAGIGAVVAVLPRLVVGDGVEPQAMSLTQRWHNPEASVTVGGEYDRGGRRGFVLAACSPSPCQLTRRARPRRGAHADSIRRGRCGPHHDQRTKGRQRADGHHDQDRQPSRRNRPPVLPLPARDRLRSAAYVELNEDGDGYGRLNRRNRRGDSLLRSSTTARAAMAWPSAVQR